ncbi:hypothetical protein [Actinacidiphila alni]|uniref:hypothetical protein n=1 Tax=Actinacidiphila alni TaxID=380248 RepID=UPI0034564C97
MPGLQEHCYKLGIRAFRLDACEPEMRPGHPHNLSHAAGPGSEAANLVAVPLETVAVFVRDDADPFGAH